MLIFNELPTAFPWYDKQGKQQRYRENAKQLCDYKLISPNNGLLPFQTITPTGTGIPTSWQIMTTCGDLAIDISNNIGKLKATETADGVYIEYAGDVLTFLRQSVPENLSVPQGAYYSVITFADEKKIFSEIFYCVPDLSAYMKIEFWNGCDISPIMYAKGFKQIIYIDSFVHTSEPEIEQDGERDGDDQIIPTFQKMVVKYRFSTMVPDYMKIALTSMQMHDEVYLTTENGTRTGKIERLTTSSTIETSGAYSTVDVVMEQAIITRTACCENMEVQNENPWNV